MKQFLIITFCLLPILINAQTDDYHILKLWKGSSLLGKIVKESRGKVVFEDNFSDTLIISRRSIARRYLIEETNDYRGDLPKLTRGIYMNTFFGSGGGRQTRTTFLPAAGTSLPILIITEHPIMIIKYGCSTGYQFNKNVSLGLGANLYYSLFRQKEPSFINEFHPYIQAQFNYEPPKWYSKNIFFIANVGTQMEFIGGISFISPKQIYKFGIAYYQGANDFIKERHLSLQAGLQF